MGWVLAWGDEPPVFSIGYAEPLGPGDSGYTVLFSNAPDPADVPENGEHPLVGPMHGHCLLEEYPEVVPGLEVARAHGAADLDEGGEWVGRSLSRV
jgi:hypothetical protein